MLAPTSSPPMRRSLLLVLALLTPSCSALFGFEFDDKLRSPDGGVDGTLPADASETTGEPEPAPRDGGTTNGADVEVDACAGCARPDAAVTPRDGGSTRLVFVTSKLANRPTSIADADARCATAAAAANLPGVFLAWISDSTTSPTRRFAHFFGDYVLVDGTTVASGWLGLTSGRLLHAIDKTETGGPPVNAVTSCNTPNAVWTGTDSRGDANAGYTCSDWTTSDPTAKVTFGNASETSSWWSSVCSQANQCGFRAALYCFEQ